MRAKDIVTTAFKTTFQHKTIRRLALLTSLGPMFLISVYQTLVGYDAANPDIVHGAISFVVIPIIALVVFFVVNIRAHAALLQVVDTFNQGQTASLTEGWARGKTTYWRVLIWYLVDNALSLLIYLPAMIPMVIGFARIVENPESLATAWNLGLTGIGGGLCGISYLIVNVIFIYSMLIIITITYENALVFEAITASWRMVRDNFRLVAGYVVAYVFIGAIVLSVTGGVDGAGSVLDRFVLSSTSMAPALVVTLKVVADLGMWFISWLVSAFNIAFCYSAWVALYRYIRPLDIASGNA